MEVSLDAHIQGGFQLSDLQPINVLTVEAEVAYATDGQGLCQCIDPDCRPTAGPDGTAVVALT